MTHSHDHHSPASRTQSPDAPSSRPRRGRRVTALVAGASAALLLSACGAAAAEEELTTLTVGTSITPQGDIMQFVADELAAEAGLEIEVVTYDDYTLPNRALVDGDLDANYFQHFPYLESEANAQGYELFAFERGIHIEPFALYSDRYEDVSEIPEGGTIGINNDPSNQGRALKLLQQAGLITLAEGVDPVSATVHDVAENPRNLEFVEADASMLAQTLPDTAASVVNGNNALNAGLSATRDGLVVESPEDNPYQNLLVVRAGEETDPALQTLDELVHTDEVRTYIEETWPDGEVIPAF
ncbi:MetQ/NlpA family ABC transporter substrate-binding protein [Brevibacterium litoralis]|uniref:MetQ/NlpA family ABC transporter substrate-binding protein n=1 Tax=Brevibacterium litoralis TaxID=3138935 RepID=UPI0032EC4700